MSEQSTDGSKGSTDKETEDDPLAELARIVSAGSVFGEISDAPADPQKATKSEPEAASQSEASTAPFAAFEIENEGGDEAAPSEETQRPAFMKALPEEVLEEVSATEPQTATEEPQTAAEEPQAVAEEPEAAADELDISLGNQLEEELLSELQVDPQPFQPTEAQADSANLDHLVSELANPLSEIPQPEVQPVDAAAAEIKQAEIGMASAPPVQSDISAGADASLDASILVGDIEQAASQSSQPDAIEEALNLDSFFDAEFAAANNDLSSSQSQPQDGSLGDIDPLDAINLEAGETPETDHFSFGLEGEAGADRPKPVLFLTASVLALAIAGGVGAYWYATSGDGGDSDVVIAASEDPVRVKPDAPGGKTIPDQDRTVYDTISGEENPEGVSGSLVDRSEELIVGVEDETETAKPEEEADNPSEVRQISSTVPPQGPRTVRTVVIRPDGSIAPDSTATASEDASSQPDGQQSTPAESRSGSLTDRVSTSDNPSNGDTQQAPQLSANDAPPVAPPAPVAAAPEAAAPEAAAPEAAPAAPEIAAPAAPEIAAPAAPEIAAPEPVDSGPELEAAPPATPAAQPSSTGGFVVQLSSQRTEEQAKTSFSSFQQRFGVLSSYTPIIKRADLGERGVFYRLQVGTFATRSEAISLCEDLKNAGGDCIVSRS